MRAIQAGGNYGEIFERNLGAGLADEAAARDERALVEGRHPLRAADALISSSSRQA